jgi:4-amino-4-deoxy-L-arabinose transferase-like glycosyltransferase
VPSGLVISIILLLAAALRFYRLSSQSLWADEGNSVALARRSFVEIAQRTAFDIHPPLYYWLLKIWISLFGAGEIGLRSLSAVLGIALVYLIWLLGTRLFSPGVGAVAALLAAVSPFQVYYSQEARMYMLLTVLGTLTVLVAWLILENYATGGRNRGFLGTLYILLVAAGLYTHYAYPIILLAINGIALVWFLQNAKLTIQDLNLFHWLSLQLIPGLLYLPWLPTVWRQITTWPSEKTTETLPVIVDEISLTLLFGHSWPYNLGRVASGGLLLMLLFTWWIGRSTRQQNSLPAPRFPLPTRLSLPVTLLWLWFLLPTVFTVFIFSPAFLKFMLVATPPLALGLAIVINWLVTLPSRHKKVQTTRRTIIPYLTGSILLAILIGTAVIGLYHYYTDPAFTRDNYRGIVNFVKAVGESEDAIILNAEGQQDVFNYYFKQEPPASMPVHPLPRQRPLNEARTLAELRNIAAQAENIYAVYWATHQADPNGLIENWLNNNLFKATDQWYGNVRLVSYGSPQAATSLKPSQVDYQLGAHIRLTGYALPSSPITPGDILPVALTWETDSQPTENYTVFVQVLDGANHLIGQRDAPPSQPAPDWPTGTPITGGYGVFIEPGTPPGRHRVIAGLYNSRTGERLPVSTGDDFIQLGLVEVVKPEIPLPQEAFNPQVPLYEPMQEVTLLGYDLYKLGHRSEPDTPLFAGDPLHLVLYWRSDQPVQATANRLSIQIVSRERKTSQKEVTTVPAGVDYPISAWEPGEIIRAQYDLLLDGLESGTYWLRLDLGGSQTETRNFRIE